MSKDQSDVAELLAALAAVDASVFRHRKASDPPYKGVVPADDSRCHISDAPALCDWSFPLGCLLDYTAVINNAV